MEAHVENHTGEAIKGTLTFRVELNGEEVYQTFRIRSYKASSKKPHWAFFVSKITKTIKRWGEIPPALFFPLTRSF